MLYFYVFHQKDGHNLIRRFWFYLRVSVQVGIIAQHIEGFHKCWYPKRMVKKMGDPQKKLMILDSYFRKPPNQYMTWYPVAHGDQLVPRRPGFLGFRCWKRSMPWALPWPTLPRPSSSPFSWLGTNGGKIGGLNGWMKIHGDRILKLGSR